MTQEEMRALVDATFTRWWASLPESIRVIMPRAEIEHLRDMVRESIGQAVKRSGWANPQITPAVEWTRVTTAVPPREKHGLGWLARVRSVSQRIVTKFTESAWRICMDRRE